VVLQVLQDHQGQVVHQVLQDHQVNMEVSHIGLVLILILHHHQDLYNLMLD
jgi:hypothetical protein